MSDRSDKTSARDEKPSRALSPRRELAAEERLKDPKASETAVLTRAGFSKWTAHNARANNLDTRKLARRRLAEQGMNVGGVVDSLKRTQQKLAKAAERLSDDDLSPAEIAGMLKAVQDGIEKALQLQERLGEGDSPDPQRYADAMHRAIAYGWAVRNGDHPFRFSRQEARQEAESEVIDVDVEPISETTTGSSDVPASFQREGLTS